MKSVIPLLCVFVNAVYATDFTLPGSCPEMALQENFDYTKFPGIWYTVATYASDGRKTYDCASMEFQDDNMGFTLRETYVHMYQGNRTEMSYFARVDPIFDTGNKAQFILSHEYDDKVLQFPFHILYTDYDNLAIAYTCKTLKKKLRMHYAFAWILSRNKEKLEEVTLKRLENILSMYPELAEHRHDLVYKEFSDAECGYTNKFETDFFTSNFW